MANTVRENIMANIKTTLEGITTVNGYDITINSVQRWKQAGQVLGTPPTIIVNAGPENTLYQPANILTKSFSVTLECWIVDDEGSTDPTDLILNKILGDVEKIMMLDITRGGYAKDTNIVSSVPFETEIGQPDAGIIIEVKIDYRQLISDPKTAI